MQSFSGFSHADKIRFFAWYIHTAELREHFCPADLRACFSKLHIAPPSSLSPFLAQMTSKRPPDLLKERAGYRLELRLREQLNSKYGRKESTVLVDSLLAKLPEKIPSIVEREYLTEAIACFRVGAFRAAIVMTWNLVYDHLCRWILDKHLVAFNLQLPKSFPKADIKAVTKMEDFAELKESQVLQVARSALVFDANLYKLLKEKLDRRNMAAHPSTLTIGQLTAEEFIRDLIENAAQRLI